MQIYVLVLVVASFAHTGSSILYNSCAYEEYGLFFYFTNVPNNYSTIWIYFKTENITRECTYIENGQKLKCMALTVFSTIDVLRNSIFYFESDFYLNYSVNKTFHDNEANFGKKNSQHVLYHSNFTFDKCNLYMCKGVVFVNRIKSLTWQNAYALNIDRIDGRATKGVNYSYSLSNLKTGEKRTVTSFNKFPQIDKPCNAHQYCMITEWEGCVGKIVKKIINKDCRNFRKSSNITIDDISCDFLTDFKSLTLSSEFLNAKIFFNSQGKVDSYYDTVVLDNLTITATDNESVMLLNGCIDCSCFHMEEILCKRPTTLAISSADEESKNKNAILISVGLFMLVAVIIGTVLLYKFKQQQKILATNAKQEDIVDDYELASPTCNTYAEADRFTNPNYHPQSLQKDFHDDNNTIEIDKVPKENDNYEEIIPHEESTDSDAEQYANSNYSTNMLPPEWNDIERNDGYIFESSVPLT